MDSFCRSRFLPTGKPGLEKTVRLSPTPVPPPLAPVPKKTKRRTLREILGGFMEIPFHGVVSSKM